MAQCGLTCVTLRPSLAGSSCRLRPDRIRFFPSSTCSSCSRRTATRCRATHGGIGVKEVEALAENLGARLTDMRTFDFFSGTLFWTATLLLEVGQEAAERQPARPVVHDRHDRGLLLPAAQRGAHAPVQREAGTDLILGHADLLHRRRRPPSAVGAHPRPLAAGPSVLLAAGIAVAAALCFCAWWLATGSTTASLSHAPT